jgi:hypothetical protein
MSGEVHNFLLFVVLSKARRVLQWLVEHTGYVIVYR